MPASTASPTEKPCEDMPLGKPDRLALSAFFGEVPEESRVSIQYPHPAEEQGMFAPAQNLDEAPTTCRSNLGGGPGPRRFQPGAQTPFPPESLFRLPIDRVFTMKGFGTVVTGTTISGDIAVGDEVTIYPQEISSRIRGIQVHNQETGHKGNTKQSKGLYLKILFYIEPISKNTERCS